MSADYNDVVAEEMDDFDRWEKSIRDDLPDWAQNAWDATSILVKAYFYNREKSDSVHSI